MKLKSIILTITLSLFALSGLLAQDKYEYASVIYSYGMLKVSISINGTEFSEEKVEIDKSENSWRNTNPLLSKINDLQSKGWEVVNIASNESGHIAYLRKKKN